MERSRPELDLAELLQLKWALGALLALVSIASAFFFDLGAGWIVPLAALVIVATGWWPAVTTRYPAWLGRLGFPALVAYLVTDLLLTGEGLGALIRLNVLLIMARAAGPRRRREDLQLVVLCLFLIVMAGVLTLSIGFIIQVVAFTAVGLGLLFAVTLVEAARATAAEPENWTTVQWGALARRLAQVTDWRLVAFSGVLFGFIAGVTCLLFLAIPRFEMGRSMDWLNLRTKRAFTGFSDRVNLGEVTEITEDQTTVLRIEVGDGARMPAQSYWRMVALDSYHAGTFRVSRDLARIETLRMRTQSTVEGHLPVRDDTPTWTFYLENGVSRHLPLPGGFARVRLREAHPIMRNPRTAVVSLQRDPLTMLAYRVEGIHVDYLPADPAVRRDLGGPVPPAVEGDLPYPHTLVEVPAGTENRAVLDAALAAFAADRPKQAREFARRAVQYLAQRHRYSLRPNPPAGTADPVVRWLAAGSAGHCEYFAGAFTLLARRAGWPTRVVTGFKGGTWNAFEGYLMVRNSEAHAWCEILDEQGRWLRVDPTPGAPEPGAAGGPSIAGRGDASWAARWDSLKMLWYRRIVNFDQQQQVELADAVRETARQFGRSIRETAAEWARRLEAWRHRPWSAGRAVQWLAIAGAAAVAAALLWRTRFQWWRRWRSGRGDDPVRRQAGRWLGRVRGAGVDDPELVAQLQRLRFGPVHRRPDPWRAFRRARRAVRIAARR